VLHLQNRALSSLEVVILSLGGLIGAGLFVGSGTAIAAAGPAIVVSYGVAGLILIVLLHLMARARRRVPGALFISDFVHVGLGARCGAVAAWLYWCFWALVVAIEALAGANILVPDGGVAGLLGSTALLVGTAVVSERVSASLSELEIGFASIKVGVIVAFVVLALCHLAGRDPGVTPLLWLRQSFTPVGVVAVFAGVVITFFSLAGVEIVHTVAASTALISMRVFGIYVISIALVLTVIRWNTIQPGFSPFALALTALHRAQAAHWLGAVILMAVLSTLNSALAICSGMFTKLTQNGQGPRLSGRFLTATLALALLCLAACWPADAYAFLVKGASVLLVVVYILFVLAVGRLERRNGRWVGYALVTLLAGALVSMAWVPGLGRSLAGGLTVVALVTLVTTQSQFDKLRYQSYPDAPGAMETSKHE
jgi:GABA permease